VQIIAARSSAARLPLLRRCRWQPHSAFSVLIERGVNVYSCKNLNLLSLVGERVCVNGHHPCSGPDVDPADKDDIFSVGLNSIFIRGFGKKS
jgi:hypothetical protein